MRTLATKTHTTRPILVRPDLTAEHAAMPFPEGTSAVARASALLSLLVPVGSLLYPNAIILAALAFSGSIWAKIVLAIALVLMFAPLLERPAFVTSYLSYMVRSAVVWNQVTVVCDKEKLGQGPFVIGMAFAQLWRGHSSLVFYQGYCSC